MNNFGEIIFDTRQQREGMQMPVGLTIGKVNKLYDKNLPDKVEVEIPIGGPQKNMRVWAKFMNTMAGTSWGNYNRPEVGDYVIIGFLDGNITKPIVLGGVYQSNSQMMSECANEKNSIKRFKTKQGGQLSFETVDDKEKVILQTKNQSQIIIDEGKDEISIIGSSGKNLVTVNSENGKITITAEEEINLQAGEAKVNMKKDGSVDMTCKQLNIKNKPNIKVEANTLKVEGMQVQMKGSTGFKAESGAMLEVKGNVVKIN